MTWTCALHPSDLITAWIAGLLVGFTVGIWGGIWAYRTVEIRRIHEHSQGGSDGQTF